MSLPPIVVTSTPIDQAIEAVESCAPNVDITDVAHRILLKPEIVTYTQISKIRHLFLNKYTGKFLGGIRTWFHLLFNRQLKKQLDKAHAEKSRACLDLSELVQLLPEFRKIQDSRKKEAICHFLTHRLEKTKIDEVRNALLSDNLEPIFSMFRSNMELMQRFPELVTRETSQRPLLPGQVNIALGTEPENWVQDIVAYKAMLVAGQRELLEKKALDVVRQFCLSDTINPKLLQNTFKSLYLLLHFFDTPELLCSLDTLVAKVRPLFDAYVQNTTLEAQAKEQASLLLRVMHAVEPRAREEGQRLLQDKSKEPGPFSGNGFPAKDGLTPVAFYLHELGMPSQEKGIPTFGYVRDRDSTELLFCADNPCQPRSEEKVLLVVRNGKLEPKDEKTALPRLTAAYYLIKNKSYDEARKMLSLPLLSTTAHFSTEEKLLFRMLAQMLCSDAAGVQLRTNETGVIDLALRLRAIEIRQAEQQSLGSEKVQEIVFATAPWGKVLVDEASKRNHIAQEEKKDLIVNDTDAAIVLRFNTIHQPVSVQQNPPQVKPKAVPPLVKEPEVVAKSHFALLGVPEAKAKVFQSFASSLGFPVGGTLEEALQKEHVAIVERARLFPETEIEQVQKLYQQMVATAWDRTQTAYKSDLSFPSISKEYNELIDVVHTGSHARMKEVFSPLKDMALTNLKKQEQALLLLLAAQRVGKKTIEIKELLVWHFQGRLDELFGPDADRVKVALCSYLDSLQAVQKNTRIEQAIELLQTASVEEVEEKKTGVEKIIRETSGAHQEAKYQVFEVLLGIFIRDNQFQSLEKLKDSSKSLLLQLLMGEGKSFVLLPLLAAMRADGTSISSCMLPSHMRGDTLTHMRQLFGAGCNQLIVDFTVPKDREWTVADIRTMDSMIEEARVKRGVLLYSPEDKHMLLNEFKLLLFQLTEHPDEKVIQDKLVTLAVLLLKLDIHEAVIGDEIDQLLQTMLQYVISLGKARPFDSKKAEIVTQLVMATQEIAQKKNVRLNFGKEVKESSLVFTKPLFHQEIKGAVVEEALQSIGIQYPKYKDTLVEHQDSIRTYLSTEKIKRQIPPSEAEKAQSIITTLPEELRDVLSGLRFTINEVLPESFFRNCNQKYGVVDAQSSLLSVPFASPDEPTQTVFSDPYEQIVYTDLSLLGIGVPYKGLEKRWSQIQKEFSLPPDEKLEQFKERLQRDKSLFLEFLKREVYADIQVHDAHIASDPHQLFSSAASVSGISGTLANLPTMPGFEDVYADVSTEVDLLLKLQEKELHGQLSVQFPEPMMTRHDRLKALVCPATGTPPLVLIDSGGWLRGWPIRDFAKEILSKRTDVKAVVFYDEKGFLVGVNKEGNFVDVRTLSLQERFTIYEQKNTVGKDLKQAPTALAIMTIDKEMILRDAEQAIYRMRQIQLGQRCTLVLDQESLSVMKELFGKEIPSQASFGLLVRFLLTNQALKRRAENPTASKQRVKSAMESTLRRAIFSALTKKEGPNFAQALDLFRQGKFLFIQQEPKSDWDKYGMIPVMLSREEMIKQEKEQYISQYVALSKLPGVKEALALGPNETVEQYWQKTLDTLYDPALFDKEVPHQVSRAGLTQQVQRTVDHMVHVEEQTHQAQWQKIQKRLEVLAKSMKEPVVEGVRATRSLYDSICRDIEMAREGCKNQQGSVVDVEQMLVELEKKQVALSTLEKLEPVARQYVLSSPRDIPQDRAMAHMSELYRMYQDALRSVQGHLDTLEHSDEGLSPLVQRIDGLGKALENVRQIEGQLEAEKATVQAKIETEVHALCDRLRQRVKEGGFDARRHLSLLKVVQDIAFHPQELLQLRQSMTSAEAALVSDIEERTKRLKDEVSLRSGQIRPLIERLSHSLHQLEKKTLSEAQQKACAVFHRALTDEQAQLKSVCTVLESPVLSEGDLQTLAQCRFSLTEEFVKQGETLSHTLAFLSDSAQALQLAYDCVTDSRLKNGLQDFKKHLNDSCTMLDDKTLRRLTERVNKAVVQQTDIGILRSLESKIERAEFEKIRDVLMWRIAFLEKKEATLKRCQALLSKYQKSTSIKDLTQAISSKDLTAELLDIFEKQLLLLEQSDVVFQEVKREKEVWVRAQKQDPFFTQDPNGQNFLHFLENRFLESEQEAAKNVSQEAVEHVKQMFFLMQAAAGAVKIQRSLKQEVKKQLDSSFFAQVQGSFGRLGLEQEAGHALFVKGSQLLEKKEIALSSGSLEEYVAQVIDQNEELQEAVDSLREAEDRFQKQSGTYFLADKQEVLEIKQRIEEMVEGVRLSQDELTSVQVTLRTLQDVVQEKTPLAFLARIDSLVVNAQKLLEKLEQQVKQSKNLTKQKRGFILSAEGFLSGARQQYRKQLQAESNMQAKETREAFFRSRTALVKMEREIKTIEAQFRRDVDAVICMRKRLVGNKSAVLGLLGDLFASLDTEEKNFDKVLVALKNDKNPSTQALLQAQGDFQKHAKEIEKTLRLGQGVYDHLHAVSSRNASLMQPLAPQEYVEILRRLRVLVVEKKVVSLDALLAPVETLSSSASQDERDSYEAKNTLKNMLQVFLSDVAEHGNIFSHGISFVKEAIQEPQLQESVIAQMIEKKRARAYLDMKARCESAIDTMRLDQHLNFADASNCFLSCMQGIGVAAAESLLQFCALLEQNGLARTAVGQRALELCTKESADLKAASVLRASGLLIPIAAQGVGTCSKEEFAARSKLIRCLYGIVNGIHEGSDKTSQTARTAEVMLNAVQSVQATFAQRHAQELAREGTSRMIQTAVKTSACIAGQLVLVGLQAVFPTFYHASGLAMVHSELQGVVRETLCKGIIQPVIDQITQRFPASIRSFAQMILVTGSDILLQQGQLALEGAAVHHVSQMATGRSFPQVTSQGVSDQMVSQQSSVEQATSVGQAGSSQGSAEGPSLPAAAHTVVEPPSVGQEPLVVSEGTSQVQASVASEEPSVPLMPIILSGASLPAAAQTVGPTSSWGEQILQEFLKGRVVGQPSTLNDLVGQTSPAPFSYSRVIPSASVSSTAQSVGHVVSDIFKSLSTVASNPVVLLGMLINFGIIKSRKLMK